MKCPKCNYLSFETGERCRNCGYDFSMSTPPPDDPAADLPLFDDRPLISVPAAPRPPLSVRRTTQDPARLRSRNAPSTPAPSRAAELDLEFDMESPPDDEQDYVVSTEPASRTAMREEHTTAGEAAPGGRRAIAAVLDLALIAGIDLAVIYLTLRLAGLDWAGLILLPLVPIAAFLLLLNGGYFVMFTAATGQTIGKMAAGIRVVSAAAPDAAHDRVTFGRAIIRTAGYLVSLLPAGLGFIPAFVGPREHRALHDRLAGTRVIRA